MINQKFNKVRLEKYATYLKKGKLICADYFKAGLPDKKMKKQVERDELKLLVVLPILELPFVFEREWLYDKDFMPFYKNDPERDMISSTAIFFGINKCMFDHIFCPGHQNMQVYGGKILGSKPTPSEIADNIFKLIESVKHYESIKDCSSVFNLN
ncbi:MAG TPA: hypothetical protein VNX01_11615 [Bacteroidia bacterium]|jgi:hypothetical protein|nr:hypothetical protein [Bacteroidia bacterium]